MDNKFKHSQLAQAFDSKNIPAYLVCAEIEKATETEPGNGIRIAPDTLRSHINGRTVPNANHLNAYSIYFNKSLSYFFKPEVPKNAKNSRKEKGRGAKTGKPRRRPRK